MKTAIALIALVILSMACSPSRESEISAIREELTILGIEDLCEVSIGEMDGERMYVIDTEVAITEYNFEDCIAIYCMVLGAVDKAIESDEGMFRFGTVSLWLDMDMRGVHSCLEVAGSNDEICEELDRYLEYTDR